MSTPLQDPPVACPWTLEPNLWDEGPKWARWRPNHDPEDLPLVYVFQTQSWVPSGEGWGWGIALDPERGHGSIGWCAVFASQEEVMGLADAGLAQRGWILGGGG